MVQCYIVSHYLVSHWRNHKSRPESDYFGELTVTYQGCHFINRKKIQGHLRPFKVQKFFFKGQKWEKGYQLFENRIFSYTYNIKVYYMSNSTPDQQGSVGQILDFDSE